MRINDIKRPKEERRETCVRFKLDFIIDRSELNADYRRCILSFIKNALSNSVNGNLLERFYKDTNTKDFSWARQISSYFLKFLWFCVRFYVLHKF